MSANDSQVGGDHYKNMGIEPWDIIDTWQLDQRLAVYRAGALKYIMRMGSKDDTIQELRKAAHYIEKMIETLQTESTL